MLKERCFQCDLDIPHVCYADERNARWGLNDESMKVLEAAQRYLNPPREKCNTTGIKFNTSGSLVEEGWVVHNAAFTRGFPIPEGWTLRPMECARGTVILTAPDVGSVTIDFQLRGFRAGIVISGRFVDEKPSKRGPRRKQYGGRGWKQALVADAVAWLRRLHT
jgi:hypothetical protein